MGQGSADAIFFTEVGPRDGLQNLDRTLGLGPKVELIRSLLAAGVDQVEATSFVSPRWVPQLADAAEVMAQLMADVPAETAGRLRVLVPNRLGLERALAAGATRVVVNLGCSESFNKRNLNHTISETLAEIAQVAEVATAHGCTWDASLSVAFGCPFEGQVEVDGVVRLASELAQLGAAELSVADTIGVAQPAQVERMVRRLQDVVPLARLALHLHDTRGLGLASALVAYRLGVRRFEGSVGGIGGCPFAPRSTGNVCSEDLLHLLRGLGAHSTIDLSALCGIAQRLEHELGRELPGRLYRAGLWPAASA